MKVCVVALVSLTLLIPLTISVAHHCKDRHPMNKIMQNFYHPGRAEHGPDAVPHILGLTASPVERSNPKEMVLVPFSVIFHMAISPKTNLILELWNRICIQYAKRLVFIDKNC